MNVPEVLEIKNIVKESETVKTFTFPWDPNNYDNIDVFPNPGEFVMVWNFKNEKPMSVSGIDKENKEISISIKNVGEFTNDIHKMKVGDKIGIRGPYGNGFNIENLKNKDVEGKNSKILAIGGGIGMAPILGFVKEAVSQGLDVDVICAAVTKDELLFLEKLESAGANILTCTDDGTCGYKGYATHRTSDLIKSSYYNMAVVCGPEIMMKATFDLLEEAGVPGQFSMERYMKCAIGLCGQCCVDNEGWRICVEGPVFTSEDMKKITEFSKYSRASSGLKKHF
ncbi:MAG: dihydroorotate dehydrogenase electron transfer subunit [Methanobacteriaceae archaeon]